MRIAIDASAAFNQHAGIGRYARQVVGAAARALPATRFCLLYAPSRSGPAPFAADAVAALGEDARVTVRRLPFSRRRADQLWFRARVGLPVQLWSGGADVVYSPDFTAPPAGRAPRLATIHDLAYLRCPEYVPPALRRYLSAVVPRQLAGSARVLTVSETTRVDLMERLGVPEGRITVVPNGVEDRFFAARPPDAATRVRLGLPARYLLIVGTVEPRKNHANLFRAMMMLPQLDLPLVVAGRRGWGFASIAAAAAGLSAAGRVIMLEYVPDRDLPALYAGAEATIYPSWYEGFGLPVLEALAAGVPTVIGNTPALLEVAAGAAVVADPGDPEAIADAILRALSTEQAGDAARAARRTAARRYRWDDAGLILAATLRQVVGGREG